ncbi:MAG TPA: FAD synthetase family protein [Candidatus Limnocylindria bacterium]|nr:FAD synthetase family protein [Candidatus Limnocylindria bacterium]
MSDPVQRLGALRDVGPAALCMGVFDGVHLGHRALVGLTARIAARRGLAAAVLLFDPPPLEVLRPELRVPRLAPVVENLRRLGEAGADAPVALQFDDGVRQLSPEDFLAALAPAIEIRALIMTPDSAFGRSRAGTPDAMREHGRRGGFEVVMLDELAAVDGEPVSSSGIRELLAAGDVAAATARLGAPPYLAGEADAQGVLAFGYLPALPAAARYDARLRSGGSARLTVADDFVAVDPPRAGPIELDLIGPAG